jgi:hypothetical protein
VTGPIVKFLVVQDKSAFFIYKSLLCDGSDYSQKCLQGNFAEAATGEALLADTSPDTFKTFVKWLYAGDVAPFLQTPSALSYCDCNLRLDIMNHTVDTLVLGDRIVCTELQNRAIDIFQEAANEETVALDTIMRAIAKAPVDSKLLS